MGRAAAPLYCVYRNNAKGCKASFFPQYAWGTKVPLGALIYTNCGIKSDEKPEKTQYFSLCARIESEIHSTWWFLTALSALRKLAWDITIKALPPMFASPWKLAII